MNQNSNLTHGPGIFLIRKGTGMTTWAEDLADGFRELGCRVGLASLRSSRPAERLAQMRDRKRLLESEAVCRRVAGQLRDFAPDLVLILNFPGIPERANAMFREVLREGVRCVTWLCDRVYEFPRGHAPLLDGVYNFDAAASNLLTEAYKNTHAVVRALPLAASPSRYPCHGIQTATRLPTLAFAGNCSPSRKAEIEAYRRLGGRLEAYGPHSNGWRHLGRNRKLSSAALGSIYRKYLVNLNLLQEGNTQHGLNLRAFEIPCAGGLATYPDVPQLADCFIPGREVVVYRTHEELRDMVDTLVRDRGLAQAIAEAGHRRVMAEHTFAHRAATILTDWIPDFGAAVATPPRHRG